MLSTTMGTYRIVAIDPSSNFVGVAILEVLPTGLNTNFIHEIVAIETFCINMKMMKHEHTRMPALAHRLSILTEYFTNILDEQEPLVFAYESAFLRNGRVSAYAPLISSTALMTDIAISHHTDIQVLHFTPPECKKSIGAKGFDKKEPVLARMLDVHDIIKCINPSEISEHEVDAITVGYKTLEYINSNRGILL